MQTRIVASLRDLPVGQEAESILRSCVHCGFCIATCPTYQLTGDELDGPRGRIYLIKQVLEGQAPSVESQLHLDRCLSCRSCETTCPSGVNYSRLLEIGRHQLAVTLPRGFGEHTRRWLLRKIIPHSLLFPMLLRIGRMMSPLLPRQLRKKLPARQQITDWPAPRHARKILILQGCVQKYATPLTNAAAARVLDSLGISALRIAQAGCCGAVSLHLDDELGAQQEARRNIDAWWPLVAAGAEAIVASASGCSLMLKEYAQLLRHDEMYAEKAARVATLSRDLSEVLIATDLSALARYTDQPIAVHTPCTLQHGQQQPDILLQILKRAGYQLTATPDSHLCCGSAGTYSMLQPVFANQLRDQKLQTLQSGQPARIVTANIGCQLHLGSGADLPVTHWIELFDPLHA